MSTREPPHEFMGFYGIYMDACKVIVLWKKIWLKIVLATILPLSILYLSDIQVSEFIRNHMYPNINKKKWIVFGIIKLVSSILILIFYLFSTSSIVYTVFCFYTLKDPNFKRVVGVFPKVCGRLLVTFLLLFFILAVCTIIYLGLLLGFMASFNGGTQLAFIICLTIPYLIVFVYISNVWNIAMVITVLERDHYGIKALRKSMRLIKGKILVSCAIFIALEVLLVGMSVGFSSMILYGKKLNMAGKIFVRIIWYLLSANFLHFYLVLQTVVYFVCKAYHNEDISKLAAHLDNSYVDLVRGNEEV